MKWCNDHIFCGVLALANDTNWAIIRSCESLEGSAEGTVAGALLPGKNI